MTRYKGQVEKPHSKTYVRINIYKMLFTKQKETWVSGLIPSTWLPLP